MPKIISPRSRPTSRLLTVMEVSGHNAIGPFRKRQREAATCHPGLMLMLMLASATEPSLVRRRRLSSMTLTKPVNDGVFHCDSPQTNTMFDSGDKGIITTEKGQYATGLQVAVSSFGGIRLLT